MSIRFDPSRPATVRRVRAAIRKDSDIDPNDYKVAKWYVESQMDLYHSLAFTFLAYVPGTAFALAAGLHAQNQMWAQVFWLTGGLMCLISIPTRVIRRLRTARWLGRHELTEII
ncbi:MAG: hypothetical protein JWR52_1781 [Marmoricola sp.]|nr:hypothetical protein [Marmoricola sp.]